MLPAGVWRGVPFAEEWRENVEFSSTNKMTRQHTINFLALYDIVLGPLVIWDGASDTHHILKRNYDLRYLQIHYLVLQFSSIVYLQIAFRSQSFEITYTSTIFLRIKYSSEHSFQYILLPLKYILLTNFNKVSIKLLQKSN